MRIAQSLIDEMVAHALEDLPNECCGMVGGGDGAASAVIPVANAAASPLRFEMDPQGQYNALKQIEEEGGELLAIYHSHTKSAAEPSQTDINLAGNWPDPLYLICSLADPDAPQVRAFAIRDGTVEEVGLNVE